VECVPEPDLRHEMTKLVVLAASLCACFTAPAAAVQRGPTAHCNDGTYYYGTSRREACAHHHGVSEWLGSVSRAQLRPSPRRPAPKGRKPAAHRPPFHRQPAGATARCKDGTWSKNPRRAAACANHGGVLRWMGRH